jgi:hypothetical protein
MADWATEFAHEVLKSEALTHQTWNQLGEQFRNATSEINGILDGKSNTKLTLTESPVTLSLTSNLNRNASVNLDTHARTMSVVVERDVYNFRLTKDASQFISTGSQLFPGQTNAAPVSSTSIVDHVIKAVVDLKN